MVAKAGLGLIGLSAISVGGVALTKPSWLGMGDPMPDCHYLSEDNGFSNGYDGKFGKTYKNYLVGVTNKSGSTGDTNTNKNWWDWAYRRWKQEKPPKGKFSESNVNAGYPNAGSQTTKPLSQVCKEAYGKEDGEFQKSTESEDLNKFKKSEVWKYCSPGEIVKVNKDDYNNGKIGNDQANSSVLVSTKANDWFWERRNKDFWNNEDSEWSGKKADSDNNKSLFKKHYDDKQSNTDGRKTIRELCEDAYKENKVSGDSNKNNDEAKKFCSLEKTT